MIIRLLVFPKNEYKNVKCTSMFAIVFLENWVINDFEVFS
jgi:hypothetical protein